MSERVGRWAVRGIAVALLVVVGSTGPFVGFAAADEYDAPSGAKTPIVSTRGHFHEGWWEDVYRDENRDATEYDTTGDVPGLDSGDCPDEIVIYVHGFQNDEDAAVENFNAARESLAANGYTHPVVGFSWDSNTGALEFDDAKQIATWNGKKLAQFVLDYRCECPDTRIRLVAHSMGARVVLNAIQELTENEKWTDCECGNGKIDSVHLLGAAVDNEEVGVESGFGSAIEEVVGEFHNMWNSEDDVLSTWYGVEEGDQALGEDGAEDASDTPENYRDHDVTDEVGDDHSGYNTGGDDADANDPGEDGVMDRLKNHWDAQEETRKAASKRVSQRCGPDEAGEVRPDLAADLPGWVDDYNRRSGGLSPTVSSLVGEERVALYVSPGHGRVAKTDEPAHTYSFAVRDGRIRELSVGERPDRTLAVYATEGTVRRVTTAGDPGTELRQALDSGEIRYEGVGTWNTVRFTAISTLDRVVGAGDWVLDRARLALGSGFGGPLV